MAEDSPDSAEPLASPQQWASMKFEPLLVDPSKFEKDWEQARGTVARTAIALLRFDDRDLTDRFMQHSEPLREAMRVHAGLQRELDYLKTHMEALEMAATRVLCVASRCAERPPS